MGKEILTAAERTPELVATTTHLALQEAALRQTLAEQGYFDRRTSEDRTCNIEHEAMVVDATTASPSNIGIQFKTITVGERPDTVGSIIEYDGGPVTPLTEIGLRQLYQSFQDRTRILQSYFLHKNAILVPIGTNPRVNAKIGKALLLPEPERQLRYTEMDKVTQAENTSPHIQFNTPDGTFTDSAGTISVMSRCGGTQFHLSEKNVPDALDAHNTSIAIAPVMIAIFGNSPFAQDNQGEFMNTGLSSVRTKLLRLGEQKRTGLPKPPRTLGEYYENQMAITPVFIEQDKSEDALDLNLGAIHHISRIIVDKKNRTIRNEFRHIDSQNPYRAMQALLLTIGCVEALRYSHERASFPESQTNFINSEYGLKAIMVWKGQKITAQKLASDLIDKAIPALEKIGLGNIGREFLDPLKEDIKTGLTQSDWIQIAFNKYIAEGAPREQALSQVLNNLNTAMF